jgi:hypothetical protein
MAAKKKSASARKVVGHVTREKGRMYYVKGNGDVVSSKMNRTGRPKGAKSHCAPKKRGGLTATERKKAIKVRSAGARKSSAARAAKSKKPAKKRAAKKHAKK